MLYSMDGMLFWVSSSCCHDFSFRLDHGYAHSLYFQGPTRMKEAETYLESKSASWSLDEMMPFLYTHLWWHYSLVSLENGEVEKAVQIFDTQLWPDDDKNSLKGDLQVQINALELLWKMETLGLQSYAHSRYESVLKVVKTRLGHHDDLLHDVLALRGYAALGYNDEIDEMMDSVNKLGKKDFADLCKAVVQVCTSKTVRTPTR